MAIEISLKSTLDPTIIAGDFLSFVAELNVAAANGRQFVMTHEQRPNGDTAPIAIQTVNITRIRDIGGVEDTFVGS